MLNWNSMNCWVFSSLNFLVVTRKFFPQIIICST